MDGNLLYYQCSQFCLVKYWREKGVRGRANRDVLSLSGLAAAAGSRSKPLANQNWQTKLCSKKMHSGCTDRVVQPLRDLIASSCK